jgi:hypothetical protein
LDERRSVSPPDKLPTQIMAKVEELERQRQLVWGLRLIQQVERSRAARWGVCGAALAIGGLPFVLLAYVSKF